jgi:hypothetical protein
MKQDIPEEVIDKAFGNANFGSTPKREVIIDTLEKIAQGYHSGHTAMCIVKELGLIHSSRERTVLSEKGINYLKFVYVEPFQKELKELREENKLLSTALPIEKRANEILRRENQRLLTEQQPGKIIDVDRMPNCFPEQTLQERYDILLKEYYEINQSWRNKNKEISELHNEVYRLSVIMLTASECATRLEIENEQFKTKLEQKEKICEHGEVLEVEEVWRLFSVSNFPNIKDFLRDSNYKLIQPQVEEGNKEKEEEK